MKQTAYLATKWVSRLSLVTFLMCNALYWGASRVNLGEHPWSMDDTVPTGYPYAIINSPFFIPALQLAFTISAAMTIWMVAEFKFRHLLPEKARQAWLHLKHTWFVVLPVFGVIYWIFSGNPLALYLGVPWIWTTVLACLFILVQYDKRPDQFILETAQQYEEDLEEEEEEEEDLQETQSRCRTENEHFTEAA